MKLLRAMDLYRTWIIGKLHHRRRFQRVRFPPPTVSTGSLIALPFVRSYVAAERVFLVGTRITTLISCRQVQERPARADTID
jgi:hypothetical protein